MSKGEKLVEVHRALNDTEAQVIKSMLESFGVPCVLQTNAPPTVMMGAFDASSGVKVMVLESRAEEARQLVKGDSDNA